MEPYARKKKSLPVVFLSGGIALGILLSVVVFGIYQAVRAPEIQVAQQVPTEPVSPPDRPLPSGEPPEGAPPSDAPPEPAEETATATAELEALQDTWPARHLFIALKGLTLDSDSAALLAELKPGGVVLRPDNIRRQEQTTALVRQIKEAVGLGGGVEALPLVAIDHEGKGLDRLRLTSPTPSAATLGAKRDLEEARQAGAACAKSCLDRGIGVLLAPVLDVATAGTPPAMRERLFSDDRTVVCAVGLAFADGVVRGGAIPVVKHYPGLGASASTSAAELAVLPGEVSAAELLFPFAQAIQVEIPGILVGHIAAPELDKDFPGRPASLSPVLVKELLRERRHFEGVILADDVSVPAITATRSVEKAAVEALAAGCDAVLMLDPEPAKIRSVCAAIGDAVENGTLSRRELGASKRRLDAWQLLLREPRPGLKTPLPELPTARVALTDEAPAESTGTKPAAVTTYTVVSGDNLTKIAKNFGVSIADLRKWNPGLTPNLKIGDKIQIGAAEPVAAAEAAVPSPAEAPSPSVETPAPDTAVAEDTVTPSPVPGAATEAAALPGGPTYEPPAETSPSVEPTSKATEEAPASVEPASELPEDAPPPDSNPITHIVKPGEYLSGIASKYDVKYQDIMKWNHLTEVKISPGDKLIVHVAKDFVLPETESPIALESPAVQPAPGAESAPGPAPVPAPAPVDVSTAPRDEAPQPESSAAADAALPLPEIKYSVQPRDALAKIADRYGVTVDELKEWNGRSTDDIKIGEVLIIRPRKMPTP